MIMFLVIIDAMAKYIAFTNDYRSLIDELMGKETGVRGGWIATYNWPKFFLNWK